MGQMSSTGIVYIATGDKFVNEARRSAKSVLRHNDVNITIYSDSECEDDIFDECRIIENPRYDMGDSVLSPSQLPYDKTLFLDTDTYVTSSITDLFDSIEQFDIGCSFNIGSEISYKDIKKNDADTNSGGAIPESFCEFNTGVLILNRSDKINNFLTSWNNLYKKQHKFRRNQPSFRKALFESNLQILPLPREYNYRLPKIAEVHSQIKIIHGRHPAEYNKIDRCINDKIESRVISRTDWPLDVISMNDVSIKFVIMYILNSGDLSDMIELIKTKWDDYTLSEIFYRISQ